MISSPLICKHFPLLGDLIFINIVHVVKTALYIVVNKTRTKLAENTLRNITPKVINDSPHCIISKILTHSLQGFKFYIKQYYIKSYNSDCSIINCYICSES